jgi:hypothetical protein
MNTEYRSNCGSGARRQFHWKAALWLAAFAGSQLACGNSPQSEIGGGVGGSSSNPSGGTNYGGSATSNGTGGMSSATGGTSTATGGTPAATGGTSTATGGTTAAPAGGSTAKGGTTGSPNGGTVSSTGGKSSATGGSSAATGGQPTAGRGGSNTGGETTKAIGGASPGGGTAGAAGRGMGGVAGKTGAGGASGGGNTGPVGGVAGTSGTGTTPGSYCPATDPCRISPLGDSITEGMGWNYPTGGGYRSKLFHLVLADGKNVTFVGTRSNGPETVDGKPFPKNHEGTSGITIQDLQKNVVDKGALTGAAVKPHIILLHIGTNNLSGGTASGNINLLSSLIDSVTKNCPDALLVVAKIIPMNGSEKGFNDLIPALVDTKAKAGAHIIMVDQSAGFTSSDIADGVHPNEGGYTKMATVWYRAISQYLH